MSSSWLVFWILGSLGNLSGLFLSVLENSLNIFIEGLLHLDFSSFCFKFEAESSCMFGSLSAEATVSPDVPLVWKQNTSLKSNKDVEILIYNGIWELKNDFF